MSGEFTTERGFRHQLMFWSCAYTGDVQEPVASICEYGDWEPLALRDWMWDAV